MPAIGPLGFLARPLGAVRRLGCRVGRDRRGNYSIIVAMLLPVITGFVALGTESGLWLYDQQLEQTAADNAAFSAAVYYAGQGASATSATMTAAQIQAAAVAANFGFGGSATSTTTCAASFNGVTAASCSASGATSSCSITGPGTGTSCVEVNYPPAGGPNAGAANCPPTSAANPCFIEVMVAQRPQQLFSALLLSNPVTIEARAVGKVTYTAGAGTVSSNACVLVTDTTSEAGAASFANNTNLSASSCDLAIDDPSSSGLTASGNAQATFGGIFDDAASIATGSISSNAAVNGTATFNVSTSNPYNPTSLPTVASATAGPCGFTAVTGTLAKNSATVTSLSSTSGISVGMFATATGLPGTSPNQNLVTAVTGTTVTLATEATAAETNELIVFGVNNSAMAITANATLQPGYYTGIGAVDGALVDMTPGTYYICPIPTTASATGNTTVSSSTVAITGGPPVGWATGMVISDSDGAIPANTIVSGIAILGTISKKATKTEPTDTFSSSAGSGTAIGAITSTSSTTNAITFGADPMPWTSGTLTDTAAALASGTTLSSVTTNITLGTTASATKTSDTLTVSGGGKFSASGSGTTFYTAPFYNSSGTTIGLPSACGTNPYTSATGCFSSSGTPPDGVTIVLLGSTGSENSSGQPTDCAAFSISGGGAVDLVPPDTSGNPGGLNGIVLTSTQTCAPAAVGTTSGAATAAISGNGTLNIYGAIDLGQYAVSFGGNTSNGNGCLQIIANTVAFSGNASLAQNCAGVGTTSISESTSGAAGTYSASLAN